MTRAGIFPRRERHSLQLARDPTAAASATERGKIIAIGASSRTRRQQVMDESFRQHVESLHPKLERLIEMPPCKRLRLPPRMPEAGIYLLSEADKHLYVGRSNGIRKRLDRHCRPSSKHHLASFAFRLAREATGNLVATYSKHSGSRDDLASDPTFAAAFLTAKSRVAMMDIRFVEEGDATRQALLEIYAAVALRTPYNDLDNH
jgi:hypothetical protein